jgi:hypothetical protein
LVDGWECSIAGRCTAATRKGETEVQDGLGQFLGCGAADAVQELIRVEAVLEDAFLTLLVTVSQGRSSIGPLD